MSAPILLNALPCPKCKAAPGEPCRRRDGKPASRAHVRRTPLAPCGTYGGYQRHNLHGESVCDECADANRAQSAQYRHRNPEVRDADRRYLRARREAVRRLVAMHRADFDRLMDEERDRW